MLFKNYEDRKGKGLVRVARLGDAHVLIVRRFDPETGESLPPETVSLDKGELLKQRAQLVEALAQLDKILADMEEAVDIGALAEPSKGQSANLPAASR